MVLKKRRRRSCKRSGRRRDARFHLVSSSDDDDAKIIDGKRIAADIRAEIKEEVERLKAKTGKFRLGGRDRRGTERFANVRSDET